MFSNFYIKQRLAKRDLLLAAGKNPYDNVSLRSIKNAEFLEKYKGLTESGGADDKSSLRGVSEARSEPRSINSVEPGRHVKDGFDKWIATPPTAARNDESQVDSAPTETIAGRVKFMRLMGKAAFIKIEDESAILQAYASASDLGNANTTESATDSATNANAAESNATLTDFDLVKKIIEVGDIIEVSGFPFVTKSGELSIHATRIKVLTKSIVPLPEKFHGLSDIELRYRQRYVDLIANADVRETFKLRSRIISLTRRFFEDKGFLEVETPMLHPIPGGANARPFTTHYNALGEERYLRIAPELYLKRLIVGGFEAVFEINRNFRNEGMDHTHNPEFSMIEFYWAYRRFGDLIALTKELFFYLLDALNLGREIEWDGMKINFNDFCAIPLKESLSVIGGLEIAVVNDPARLESAIRAVNPKLDSGLSYGKLLGEAFDEFVEAKLINPTFITDYPIEISPLARRNDGDSSIADRFELFIGGKEIANGFSELNDPLDQLARFKEQVAAKEKGDEEAQYMDEDFVWALGHGMPPTAGQGIGIDRLVMLLSGQKSIKDVILFPAMRTGRVADLESAQDSKRESLNDSAQDSKQESAQDSKRDSAKDSKKKPQKGEQMSDFLKTADSEIYELINKEWARQESHLEMIASENFTFPAVIAAMGSVLTNKYAEGYPGKRYYGGCEFVDEIENIAIERAKKLFGCAFANVQPHSGSQANMPVYNALLKPYDKILGMDLSHGGHLTHGAKVSATGQVYQSFFYGVESDGRINYDKLADIAALVKPKMIVCGFSAYTRELDFAKFREIADSVGALLFGDMAHIAGLVVAGEYPNPFPHCHVVTTTTHKTLRGPRGGVILTNDEEIATKINKAVFPGAQGGPLMNLVAAKAVGFKENLKPEWKIYAKQVKANIKVLGQTLVEKGFELVSGGTDNHLILMDFKARDFSGKDADIALGNAGITVNKNTVPGETRSPFVTSGVRIGSPALTSRGMKEAEFKFIGEKIAQILSDINNTDLQKKIKSEIAELSAKFPIYDRAIF